ncbi:RecA-family ATPase-like protein [Desulfatibacillum aliphaticivorans]|uniref:RecA-family ATPase-like protein n=1 Tax=Desulfatibacillum aliphaticivorans TaxID=218208 RepID=B8FD33_DESAL|nr:AAA family ATPase [Desulfatibacillum aliphaticivorans]ACL06464.1 RecA-family ATPase-like protein [Desulfatibacillum aliphaticivorans]
MKDFKDAKLKKKDVNLGELMREASRDAKLKKKDVNLGELMREASRDAKLKKKDVNLGELMREASRDAKLKKKEHYIENRVHGQEQFVEQEEEKEFPPLAPNLTSVSDNLIGEPQPVEGLLMCGRDVFLPKGILCALMATGGTGKSFFLLLLCHGMASGKGLGPLKPPRPMNVLYLAGEDPQQELERRLWCIGHGTFPKGLYAHSVAGKSGPLMKLQDGNPIPTRWFDWLDKTITAHPELDLLVIDPKSRFYGLNENDNDQATQWVSALEWLLEKHKGLTILFAHHTSKQSANDHTQHAGRGASAIVDGIRWAASMTSMNNRIAKEYNVDDPNSYVEFTVTKSNYAPKPNTRLFWKRGHGGVLEYTDIETIHWDNITRVLLVILADDGGEYSRRELCREKKCDSIMSALKDEFDNFNRRRETDTVVNHAIKEGWLEERQVATGKRPKKVLCLTGKGKALVIRENS